MAAHRMPKKGRAQKAIAAAAVAVGLSGPLVFGHAIDVTAANLGVDLANAVLGIGGKDDTLSANIPAKLSGKIAPAEWGDDYTYYGIPYLADINFQSSMDDGVPKLTQAIADNGDSGIRVVSYSEGTLVAEAVKRRLADVEGAPSPDDIDFLFIASPYLPNGGVFARFPGFSIPGLLPDFGPAEPTPYDSTYVTNQYDTYADFPAYFNPLSIANALLSIRYAHPDPYYDPVDVDNLPAGSVITTVPDNGAGGTDTYILVYARHLPLLGPVREVAGLLFLTPLTEPVLAALEPVIRLVVDMGYTDRTYANPATPTPFSFITPHGKIVEALLGVPGALQQGVTDAVSGGQESVQDTTVTSFAVPAETSAAENERSAPAPSETPSPVGDPAPADPATVATVATGTTTAPEPEPEPVAEPDVRITHPTVTSDGNKSEPTTTVAGGTAATPGGASVTPIATDHIAGQEDTTTPAADSAAAPAPATDPEPAAHKAA